MRIEIKGSGFPITTAILNHTERRIRFALTRTSDRIVKVAVLVGDSNGPRGGEDKFCRMRILLKGTVPILIEDAGADLYAVIDRTADRAGRNVAKRIDRLKRSVRQTNRKPLRSPPDDVTDAPGN